MKFDEFLDTLAYKARQELVPGHSPRDIVLQRISDVGMDELEEEQRSLFWAFAISGVAACLSVLVSLDAYELLTDPLGLFIGVLGYLPLEV
jgi:hypothetical protein